MKDPSLRTEAQEKRLMKWIRPICSRRLFNTVTTAMVKEQWAKIYYGSKKPSKANLNRFRTRNGLKTITNPKPPIEGFEKVTPLLKMSKIDQN